MPAREMSLAEQARLRNLLERASDLSSDDAAWLVDLLHRTRLPRYDDYRSRGIDTCLTARTMIKHGWTVRHQYQTSSTSSVRTYEYLYLRRASTGASARYDPSPTGWKRRQAL